MIITQTKSTRKGRAEQKIEFLGDRALEILELRFLGRRHFQIWQHFATSLLNCCSICRSLTPNICLSTRGQCSIVPGKNLLRCQNRQKVQTRLGQKMRTMISCAQLRLHCPSVRKRNLGYLYSHINHPWIVSHQSYDIPRPDQSGQNILAEFLVYSRGPF